MSAIALFKAFLEDNTEKVKEISSSFPPSTKCSLPSIKDVYKSRKKQGMTPFITAILHGNKFLCELLIDEDTNLYQHWDNIPLPNIDHENFLDFDHKAVNQITYGPKENVFTEFNMTTPMFWAIKCNFLSLVSKLLSKRHSVNAYIDKYSGMPILPFAVVDHNMSVVEHLLLNKLGDIHMKCSNGMTALDIAIRSSNSDAVKLLFKYGEFPHCVKHDLSPLLLAIFINSMSMVRLILKLGADVNFGIEKGSCFPPLNMAALKGQFDIVKVLIDKGADVTKRDSTGCTALHLLAQGMSKRKGNSTNETIIKVAQLLLDKGAQVDIADNSGKTPIFEAVVMDEPELLEMLLSTFVNPSAFLKREVQLLQAAVTRFLVLYSKLNKNSAKESLKKQLKIIKLLTDKGADVNQENDSNGITALHVAAKAGNYDLVKILLACNANINKQAFDGKVALHYAVSNGNFKLVQLMLESKAKVNIKDNVGSSPFDYGIMENELLSCETIKLLIEYGADIYNYSILGVTRTYDMVVAMIKCDVMKLLWSEGYPYDLTLFQSPHNLIDSMHTFFNLVGAENIVTQDFYARLSPQNCKRLSDLLSAQRDFLTGVERNNVQLVLSGLKSGAQVRGCSVDFPFPLHFAAKKGFTGVAYVLLSNGMPTNTLDNNGDSSLSYAAKNGHFKVCLALLKYGACYNELIPSSKRQANNHTKDLRSSIDQAFRSVKLGNHRVLKKVKKLFKLKDWDIYHAMVNCVDKKGRTLMDLALQRGKSHIAEELMQYRLQAPELA